ncbi:MAG: 1-acyl-sn-glycerol-3-phosphate acyltransferase [Alphaproteobacteria bacterium]
MLEKFRDNTRATVRAAIGIAAVVPVFLLTAFQGFVVGKVSHNTTIPTLIYKGLGKLLGVKVAFNKASAPIDKKQRTWFVANHQSIIDFVVLGSTLNATFAGKGDLLKQPFIAQMARAVKYIGLRRSAEYNDQSRAKLINNFNDDYNAIVFPEATTTPTNKMALFRAPLFTVLFGEKGKTKEGKVVSLDKDVVLQPVAIKVKTVNGQDATDRPDLHDCYNMYNEDNTLKRIWRRLKIKEMEIELTAFPAMKPVDYQDAEPSAKDKELPNAKELAGAKAIINDAALKIASVVNPGQTTFEKAAIPGQPAAKPAAPTPSA